MKSKTNIDYRMRKNFNILFILTKFTFNTRVCVKEGPMVAWNEEEQFASEGLQFNVNHFLSSILRDELFNHWYSTIKS